MSEILAAVLSNCLFAGALAGVAWGLTRLWRDPFVAHVLWLLVLIKLVTPPVAVLPVWWASSEAENPDPVSSIETSGDVPVAFDPAVVPNGPTFDGALVERASAGPPFVTDEERPAFAATFTPSTGWLVLPWLVGVVGLSFLGLRRHRRLVQLCAAASPPDERLQAEIADARRRLGLDSCPTVRVTDACVSPLVALVGWRPVVLLPSALFGALCHAERVSILVHEFAHLKRRDHLVRVFEVLVLVLHWWNPLAWWASRQLRRNEEECCDCHVVHALPDHRRDYGRALLRTVEFVTERSAFQPVAASSFGRTPFERRVEMIVSRRANRRLSWPGAIVVAGLAVVTLPLAAQLVANDEVANDVDPVVVESDTGGETAGPFDVLAAEGTPAVVTDSGDPFGGETEPDSPEPVARVGRETRRVTGVLRPASDIVVSARADGILSAVETRVGQTVKKGQGLAKLDDAEARLALSRAVLDRREAEPSELLVAEARVAAEAAAGRLERMKAVPVPGVFTSEDVKQVESDAKIARLKLSEAERRFELARARHGLLTSAVEVAKRRVADCTVRSPGDGVLIEVHGKVGEFVRRGDELFRVVDLRRLVVEAFVRGPIDDDLPNRTVRVTVKSRRGVERTVKGKVVFVSPIVDPVSGQTRIHVEFANVDEQGAAIAAPGTTATIEF